MANILAENYRGRGLGIVRVGGRGRRAYGADVVEVWRDRITLGN